MSENKNSNETFYPEPLHPIANLYLDVNAQQVVEDTQQVCLDVVYLASNTRVINGDI